MPKQITLENVRKPDIVLCLLLQSRVGYPNVISDDQLEAAVGDLLISEVPQIRERFRNVRRSNLAREVRWITGKLAVEGFSPNCIEELDGGICVHMDAASEIMGRYEDLLLTTLLFEVASFTACLTNKDLTHRSAAGVIVPWWRRRLVWWWRRLLWGV